jgi:hypothetical protein
MRACTSPIQGWKSDSAALTVLAALARFALGGSGGLLKGPQDIAFQDFYLLLCALQPLLAEAGELEPALVRGERLFEGKIAAFHAGNDFFQFGQRLLEAQLRGIN